MNFILKGMGTVMRFGAGIKFAFGRHFSQSKEKGLDRPKLGQTKAGRPNKNKREKGKGC